MISAWSSFDSVVPDLLREDEDLRDHQVAGLRVVLRVTIVLAALVARLVVLRAVDHAGLHRIDQLVEAHRDAVAAEGVHGVDEHGVAHHSDLEPLEVVDRLDRLLAVVDVTGAGIHPAQADQIRLRMSESFLSSSSPIGPSITFSMCASSRNMKGRLNTFSLRHDRAHRTDADARDRERADLRLLDHLLFAAELHRRKHLDAQTSVGCGLELLAHLDDRFHRRIAERMHVGRLEHELLLREGRARCKSRGGEENAGGRERNASLVMNHSSLSGFRARLI